MRKIILLAALCAPASWLRAQDTPQEAPPADGLAGVVVLQADGVGEAPGVIQLSFTGDSGVAFAAPMMMVMNAGAFSNSADPASLVTDKQIQQDLDLIDSQMQELRKIQSEFSERQRVVMKSMAAGGGARDPKRMGELQAAMDDLRKERTQRIEAVMLPHQRERLKQLAYHMSMQRQGVANALSDGPLAEALALSDEQKERLKQKAEALEAELKEELTKLRAKAKKEIFAELSAEQQAKLEKLLGDDFQYRQ